MADDSFDEIDDFSEDDFATEQNSELYEHYRFVADKGQGQIRVDKYLAMHIVGVSRNRITTASEADCILVNDNPVKSKSK